MEKKIRKKVITQLENEKKTKTKMRSIMPGRKQTYIEECAIEEVSNIMRIRLHMVYAKANYGGGKCRRCEIEEETTEHVLCCQSGGDMVYDEGRMEDTSWLRSIRKIYKLFDEQFPLKESQ